jgi:flagellar biosynthesis protein FliQ
MNDMLVDALNSAFGVVLIVATPVLLIGLVVSLVTSLLQAMTQVQEQTLSLIPRLLAMLVSLLFLMGWMLSEIMTFATEMFSTAV